MKRKDGSGVRYEVTLEYMAKIAMQGVVIGIVWGAVVTWLVLR